MDNQTLVTSLDIKMDLSEKESNSIQPEQQKAYIEPIHKIINVGNDITFEFSNMAWNKIKTWVDMSPIEVSGLGCVKREPNGIYYIYDAFLVKQENTSSFTDIDDEALLALMWQLEETDTKNNTNKLNDLRCWWHSHANMNVFWSGQDDSCIKSKMTHATWWVSAVFNKKGEVKTRLDIQNPPMRFDDIKYDIRHEISEELKQECKKEYDEKVITKFNDFSNNFYNNKFNNLIGNYPKRYNNYNLLHKYPTEQESNKVLAIKKTNSITFQTTPLEAKEIYKDEILFAKNWLSEKMSEYKITELSIVGYGFNPKASTWMTTGDIHHLDNLYMLIIRKEDYEKYYVTKLKSHFNIHSNRLYINNSNKFTNMEITYSPNHIATNNDLDETCIGLIFKTKELWPINEFGYHFLEDDYDELTDITFLNTNKNAKNTESPHSESKELYNEFNDKNDYDEDNYDEDDPIIKSSLQEVEEYAKKQPPEELIKRIKSNINKFESIEDSIDYLLKLVEELAVNATEQEIEDNIDFMTIDLINKELDKFINRDPVSCFKWLWWCIPAIYFCQICYEPITEEQDTCPYCNIKLENTEE